MKAELLRKEKELILLKQQQIDMQIQEEKRKMLPAPPIIRDETVKSFKDKDKKDRSPSSKSHKSDSKKSSSSKSSTKSSSHSKSSSSSSKSSSNSNSRPKDEKENTVVKKEKVDIASRKRTRDADVSLSPSPTREGGRISPLPPPPQSRILKVTGGSFGDSLSSLDTQESDKKRGIKRPGTGGKVSPPPDKRSKSLFIETDVAPGMRDAPSPQVGGPLPPFGRGGSRMPGPMG